MDKTDVDPKGLIREAYRIPGISAAECRSIFLDWALSLPEGADEKQAVRAIIDIYAASNEYHPMNAVLNEGLAHCAPPKRRGGWKARRER